MPRGVERPCVRMHAFDYIYTWNPGTIYEQVIVDHRPAYAVDKTVAKARFPCHSPYAVNNTRGKLVREIFPVKTGILTTYHIQQIGRAHV